MKKILIVNVNWLGDTIMTLPAFKALKEKFPSASVAVMAPERVKEVFTDNPYINEVIIFDEKKDQRNFFARFRFASALKQKNFDTVFLVHRSTTRAFICFLAGITTRIGYKRLKNMLIINKMVAPPDRETTHKQDYYLYLFEKTGININDKLPKVYIPLELKEKYRKDMAAMRLKHAGLVGINPSANWLLKRWPEENFASLSDRLIRELNYGVVFIGAENDTPVVSRIIRKMKEPAYNFCGQTGLKELAALIENMDLFISNDSGPAHLAASLGTNTLVLFGPTSLNLSAPRGKSVHILKKSTACAIPCYNSNCQDNLCMKNISVEDVFIKAKEILSGCLRL